MQHLISNLGEMAYSTLNSSQPRFNNYTRANCGIPMTPLPLPGRKSSEYDHTSSRYAGTKTEEHLFDDDTEKTSDSSRTLFMSSIDQGQAEAEIPLTYESDDDDSDDEDAGEDDVNDDSKPSKTPVRTRTDEYKGVKPKKASTKRLKIEKPRKENPIVMVVKNPPKLTHKPNEGLSVSDSNIFKQLNDGKSLASIKANLEKELKRLQQDLKIINLLFSAEQSNTDDTNEASVQDLKKRFVALENEMALIKKQTAAKDATDKDREANNSDADEADNEESNAGNKSGKPDDDDAADDDQEEPVKPVTTKTNSGKVPVKTKAGSAPKKGPAQTIKTGPVKTNKKGPAATNKGPAATPQKGPAVAKKGSAPATTKKALLYSRKN